MRRARGRIPPFDRNGNLPPGRHRATLGQIRRRFAFNPHRRGLFAGLKRALANLQEAGVRRVFIAGSFVTAKDDPNDVDGCYEWSTSIDVRKLDVVFLDPGPRRAAMKAKYGVDFLISGRPLADAHGRAVEEFFQVDREGNRKGIVLVKLGGLDDTE